MTMMRYDFEATVMTNGPYDKKYETTFKTTWRVSTAADSEHEARRKAIMQCYADNGFVKNLKLLKKRSIG